MNNTATVVLWGTKIGYFHLEEDKGYVSFEYDKDFIKMNIEVAPIKMPISQRIYQFPDLAETSFRGVPGLLADSLPDKFGNAVINQWLASQGRTEQSFHVVERLCYTGKRGMGALEYEPVLNDRKDENDKINLDRLVGFASEVLRERKSIQLNASEEISYNQLLQLGTSAGGARAKAIIAYNETTKDIRSGQVLPEKGYTHWLIKFDGVSKNGDHDLEDAPQYTKIEYAYYLMALQSKITMSECKLLQDGARNHFMTKRFDRHNGSKIHMQSLGAMLHIDYDEPGLCSYEMGAQTGRRIGLTHVEIQQFFRRMVFNVMAVNQDDHVKNISFLMDRNGRWYLSPAYDCTFACDSGNKWLQAHQMTINGKQTNITYDDLIAAGQSMDLRIPTCKKIMEEVRAGVMNWKEIGTGVGINEETISLIGNEMRKTDLF